MTKDEVINSLKALASQFKNKKYITLKEIRSVPKLDYYIQFHFRKLGNALQAANLPSSKLAAGMKITNEQLINYLIGLRNKLGRSPKVWDFADDKDIYKKYSEYKISWSIYKTRFGGLVKAKELAGMKDNKVEAYRIHPSGENLEESEEILPKNRFWGEAAELHVLAELLYRQFQAANIPVDVGLDILAFKNNKTYYFQVKHKDLGSNQAIKITKSSFKKTGGGEVYYIFVLLSDERRDFLIIPYHIMNDWIREKLVEDTNDGYLMYIKKQNNNYKLKEKTLSNYLNNWDVIR